MINKAKLCNGCGACFDGVVGNKSEKCPDCGGFLEKETGNCNNPNCTKDDVGSETKEPDKEDEVKDEKPKGKITTPSATIAEVYDEISGKRFNVVANASVVEKDDIAGGQSKKTVQQADRLAKQYGGNATDWQKKACNVTLDVDGQRKRARVHSFYNPNIGYVEQKVKRMF